jgi:ubiquinone/menaquinone biosynthesis C-methylase UbiE
LREIRRVLRAGGELHIADFGKLENALVRVVSFPWQLFEGFHTTADNVKGFMPELIRSDGFVEVYESDSLWSGSISR